MSPVAPSGEDRLPTLTEVLEWGGERAAEALPLAVVAGAETEVGPDRVEQVLAALQPRVEALLESRLREALAPALARAADGLIRDARAELAPALRDLVTEAVAQALRQPR